MNNPTHFIEVFSEKTNVRGRTEQSCCIDIVNLPTSLNITNICSSLKTVAVFKIKMK